MQSPSPPDPAGPDVPPSLFSLPESEGYGELDRAVDQRSGSVAVTAPPYAGRGAALAHLADRLGTEVVTLAPDRTDPPPLPDDPGEALVVDGCHHLYDRRVDGFEPLERFLHGVARSDALVVAGWNASAWAYLDAARDVGAFDHRFAVPGLDREAMETYVLDRHEGAVTFAAESTDETSPVTVEETTVTVAGRAFAVPVPRYDPDYRSARRAERFDDPAAAAFARLTDVSDGHPGVAWAVWRESVVDGTVTVGEVASPVAPVGNGVAVDGAFLLRVVLCSGRTTRERLRRVVGERTDRRVRSLSRAGYLAVEGGTVSVAPGAVPRVAAFCDRRRVP